MSSSQNSPYITTITSNGGMVSLQWTYTEAPTTGPGGVIYAPEGFEWANAGSAQGLVLTNYRSAETYLTWLPDWYLVEDAGVPTDRYPDGPGPLTRFMNMLGYETDWIRSEIETMSTFNNADYISGALLPALGGNFGVQYEPELGMTRSRALVKNAVRLYKTKGIPGNDLHPGGISGAASSFSGYGAIITVGHNMEIQLDDCAFDKSVGHWTPNNVLTFIEKIPVSSITGAGGYGFQSYHSNYEPVPQLLEDQEVKGYLPISNDNVLRVTADNTFVSITTCTTKNATTLGIPCIPQATPQLIVLSAAVCPENPNTPVLHSWFMEIDWYGQTGNYISSTQGPVVTEIPPPSPIQPGGQWVRMYVTGYPPPGAYFFGRTINSVDALNGLGGGDYHLIDAVQIELNTQNPPGPTSWDPPRDIKINLFPLRRNLIPNPVGQSGTYGWSTSAGTLGPDTNIGVGWPAETLSGFQILATGAGAYQINSTQMNVYGDQVYSLSLYLKSGQTSHEVVVNTVYYDTYGNTTLGPYFSMTTIPGTFVRKGIAGFQIPPGIVGMSFQLTAATAQPNEVVFLGAPLFAPESSILPYFDANFLPLTDYSWDGALNQSASNYYPALPTRLSRLITTMPDYVPIGSTFSLVIAPEAYKNVYGSTTYISPPAPPPPPVVAPGAPVLLEAVPGNSQVTLVWTTNSPPATPTMVSAVPGNGEILISWTE